MEGSAEAHLTLWHEERMNATPIPMIPPNLSVGDITYSLIYGTLSHSPSPNSDVA